MEPQFGKCMAAVTEMVPISSCDSAWGVLCQCSFPPTSEPFLMTALISCSTFAESGPCACCNGQRKYADCTAQVCRQHSASMQTAQRKYADSAAQVCRLHSASMQTAHRKYADCIPQVCTLHTVAAQITAVTPVSSLMQPPRHRRQLVSPTLRGSVVTRTCQHVTVCHTLFTMFQPLCQGRMQAHALCLAPACCTLTWHVVCPLARHHAVEKRLAEPETSCTSS